MRRLLAVLMTALLVTSAAGAAMVIGAPAMQEDHDSDDSDSDLSLSDVEGGILLTGIASDSEDGLSQMRVRSSLDEDVTLSYRVAGSGETGTVTAKAGQDTFFNVNTSGATTVVLMYDGQNVETKNANTVSECDLGEENPPTLEEVNDGILLTGICSDSEDGLSQMRVRSSLDQNVTLDYRVAGSGETGTVEAVAGEDVFFDVNTSGATTVVLMYEGENVETKNANTVSECDLGEPNVDTEDLTLTSICSDDGEAKYRVTNDNDVSVTVTYDKYGTDVEGELTVDANGEAYFTVPENSEGPTTVRLFYEGERIDTKAANGMACDDGDDADDGMDDGDDSDSDDGMDDGDDSDSDDGQDGDMADGEDMPAYQIDVAAGEVIEQLGVDGDDEDDAPDFYGTQGRLLQAQTVLADGTVTGSYMVPTENVTKSLAGCHVSYTPVSYDGETGEVTLTVSVDGDADCEGVTLTLAGYELPGDDTTFVRANADDQELVAYETVTLEAGQSGTVVIDLDEDAEA